MIQQYIREGGAALQ